MVPLAGMQEKMQAKLNDPLGLIGAPDMMGKLAGQTVTLHVQGGLVLPCKIVGTNRYEVLVVDKEGKKILVSKHAIDWTEF